MAQIASTTVDRTGVSLVGAAATATTGDTFANTGREFVIIKNGGTGAAVATLKFGPNAKVDGQAATDRTVNLAIGETRIIGPFPIGTYNDVNGNVQIICAPVTSVTIQVVSCPAGA